MACTGIGLHSGRPVRLRLRPAPAEHGIRFFRTDVGVEIDRTPPLVEVSRPEAEAYLDRIDAVIGSVSDRNLSGWTVVAAPDGGGPIPLADVKGRVDYIYWPALKWSRFGKVWNGGGSEK